MYYNPIYIVQSALWKSWYAVELRSFAQPGKKCQDRGGKPRVAHTITYCHQKHHRHDIMCIISYQSDMQRERKNRQILMTGHGIQYLIFAWTPSCIEYVRKASVGHFEQGKQQCLRFWGCTPPLHTCLRMSKFWALCWCLRFFNRSWIPWLNPLQSLHVSFIHVDFCWTKTWRLTGTTDKRTWGLQKVRLGLSPGQIDHCILRVSGSIHLYTSSKSCKPGSIQRLYNLFILTALFIILCPIMTHLVLSCSCSPAGFESRYWMWWLACSNMQLDSERLNGSYHIRRYQTYHSVYIF